MNEWENCKYTLFSTKTIKGGFQFHNISIIDEMKKNYDRDLTAEISTNLHTKRKLHSKPVEIHIYYKELGLKVDCTFSK